MSDAALIDYLDAPVLVGDPDANAVHVNPAFERRFGIQGAQSLGTPLAELFEGGAREAMLASVASACERGESARCRIRERGVGYSALISPILQNGEGVGVVVLLTEEVEGAELLVGLRRQLEAPADEIAVTLETLIEETGGRRNPGHRARLEDALRNLERLRKSLDEMGAVLAGKTPEVRAEPFDPARVVRQIADGLRERAEVRGVELQLLAPATLEGFCGDGTVVEAVLRRMVEARLLAEPAPLRITLGVRALGESDGGALLVSLTEKARDDSFEGPFEDPAAVQEGLAGLGALAHGYSHPRLGRTTVVRLLPGS
ncbi:MAG: hypothetical protein CL910_13815 [Deltaproteobacteria bacterium]|jgi:hypothetical protein|nr:hypothetical protein [Deltaproteobacteria bacterium]